LALLAFAGSAAAGAEANRSVNMTDNVSMEQEREWSLLYEQIREMLRRVGEEKHYCLLDYNMGLYRHRVETERLEFVQPAVIKSLQKLLSGLGDRDCSRQWGGWSFVTTKLSTDCSVNICRWNFRPLNMKEAGRSDRSSAT
jgi:hypothetical protein